MNLYADQMLALVQSLKTCPHLRVEDGALVLENGKIPLPKRARPLVPLVREAGRTGLAATLYEALEKPAHPGTIRADSTGLYIGLRGVQSNGAACKVTSREDLVDAESHYRKEAEEYAQFERSEKERDDLFLAELRALLSKHGARLISDSGCCGDASVKMPSGKEIDLYDV